MFCFRGISTDRVISVGENKLGLIKCFYLDLLVIPGMIARIKKYIGYNGGDGVAKKIKERLKKGDVRMICYVILHYKNMDDTIKCVESLNNTADCSSRYIIVDNGSGDGSGEKLELLYRDNAQCNVLILPENLGFSKGNNEGYQYAKQKFHPDYIVITNNDVVFFQKDFEKKIMQIYRETHFDILGPDIYVPRHRDHQSPMFKKPVSISQLENEIKEFQYYQENPIKFSRRLKLHAFKNMLCSKSKGINHLYSKLRGKDILDYRKRYIDVGLQGACLIVSKDFICNENKAFDPEPFLYEEEVFLFYRCKQKGYRMVYDPSIAIRHEEAASFSNMKKNKLEKIGFMLDHHVRARKMLLDYLKSGKEQKNYK